MKKKSVVSFLVPALILLSVASFAVVLAGQTESLYFHTKGNAASGSLPNYSVQFGKNKNRFINSGSNVSGDAIARTENGANLSFRYTCVSYSSDCWLQFNDSSSNICNTDKIHSITSISIETSNKELVQLKINYYYGTSGHDVEVLEIKPGELCTHNFETIHPDTLEIAYFNTKNDDDGKLVVDDNGGPINITNMTICYLCS